MPDAEPKAAQRAAGERSRMAWLPPSLVLGVAAASFVVYNHAPRAVAEIAILPYALCLILGPSLVYPWLRRGGATVWYAASASLLVPGLWLLKEGFRIAGVFSIAEAVYYAFNPLSLGLFTGAAFQMAGWELVLRRLRVGRWQIGSGPALVIAAILLLAGGFALLAQESGGREAFYAYIAVYRWLFPDA